MSESFYIKKDGEIPRTQIILLDLGKKGCGGVVVPNNIPIFTVNDCCKSWFCITTEGKSAFILRITSGNYFIKDREMSSVLRKLMPTKKVKIIFFRKSYINLIFSSNRVAFFFLVVIHLSNLQKSWKFRSYPLPSFHPQPSNFGLKIIRKVAKNFVTPPPPSWWTS